MRLLLNSLLHRAVTGPRSDQPGWSNAPPQSNHMLGPSYVKGIPWVFFIDLLYPGDDQGYVGQYSEEPYHGYYRVDIDGLHYWKFGRI